MSPRAARATKPRTFGSSDPRELCSSSSNEPPVLPAALSRLHHGSRRGARLTAWMRRRIDIDAWPQRSARRSRRSRRRGGRPLTVRGMDRAGCCASCDRRARHLPRARRQGGGRHPLGRRRPGRRVRAPCVSSCKATWTIPRAGTEFDGFFGRSTFAQGVDRFLCSDLVLHGWDLARATGLDETMDPAEIHVCSSSSGPSVTRRAAEGCSAPSSRHRPAPTTRRGS